MHPLASNTSTRSGWHTTRSLAGFSLIELMVVILIIGLGIQLVGINIGGNSRRQVLQEAKQFVNVASLAAEEAVLTRQQWGVDFFREFEDGKDVYGYRWLRQEQGRWQLAEPLPEQEAETRFSAGVELRLEFDEIEQEIGDKKPIPPPEPVDDEKRGQANGQAGTATLQAGYSSPQSAYGRAQTGYGAAQAGYGNQQSAYGGPQMGYGQAQGVIQDDENAVEPHIWMLSSGEMTPFSLFIVDVDDPESEIIITGDELGRVRIKQQETDDEQF